MNRAYVDFVGCNYDEALSLDWRTIIHPDDAARIRDESIKGEASLTPFNLVGRYRNSEGEWRWLSSVSNPRWGPDNTPIGFIGVAHDITESKAAEIAFREREAQLSAFITQSAAGFAQVDLNGKFTLANDRFCEICGWKREELLGLTMQDIMHPDDADREMALLRAAALDGTPFTDEMRYLRPDGTTVWVSHSMATVSQQDGVADRILAVTLDVTDRRESEAALRRASESMRLAIEGAGMATWELDLSTMIGPWSPNRFDILGYPRAPDGRGSFDDWLARVHPECRESTEAAARECFAKGTPFEIEYRILRADSGEERWLRSNGTIIHDQNGRDTRFVGVSFDITDKKKAEAHQQLLIDELNHRVKNTLAIVQSIAHQSARSGASSEDVANAFEGRLAALSTAHNLLTAGLWQPTKIGDLVNACLKPLARTDQIRISGPPVTLGTKAAITLALAMHELASNAAKYGSLSVAEGTVDIRWTNAGEFTLVWTELGGPAVSAPLHQGYGLKMIERGLAAEFGGRVELSFEPQGLICRLSAVLPGEVR